MTDDLREKIAAILHADDYFGGPDEAELEIADEILAIPEIAEALEWVKARRDALYGGTSFMRDGKRIDPSDVYLNPKPNAEEAENP